MNKPSLKAPSRAASRTLRRKRPALGALLLGALLCFPAPSSAREIDEPSPGQGEGLKVIAEIPFEGGSHLEHATIKGRDYAFVAQVSGSEPASLRVIDVTNPARPKVVGTSPCMGFQGNIQVSHDKKTLLIGLDDTIAIGGSETGPCPGAGGAGFITMDITDPKRPRAIGFAEMERGSHSLAAHPTKPFVYNGHGFPEAPGAMEVWSIKNPARPKLVNTLDTGAHSPHDLAFNADGTMAATANAVNFHLLDTRDPANPKVVLTSQCPGCVHTHEARFTPDGKTLIVNDEYQPVSPACPGGFIYFYDLTGDPGAPALELTGAYTAEEKVVNSYNESAAVTLCTPHVFDISADGKTLAASWNLAGTKLLDIRKMNGITAGSQAVVPGGPVQTGWYANQNGDAFAAKMFKGPYVYVVDSNIGFQVLEISN